MSNFIDKCLNGDCLVEEIDDYVDLWHEGDSTESLHSFLGMTEDEYGLWMRDSEYIYFILEAHKSGRHVYEIQEEFRALPLAARGDIKSVMEFTAWLKQNKILS